MMMLQARKANVGMVIATQDLSRASKAGIADTIVGSTTTKIVSRLVGGDARRLASAMKTNPEFLLGLEDHRFAFTSGNQPAVSIKAFPNALDSYKQRDNLEKLRKQMAEFYGPQDDTDPDIVDKPPQEKRPAGKYGPNDELKPSPVSKGKASTKTDDDRSMSKNDNQDIEPTDTL